MDIKEQHIVCTHSQIVAKYQNEVTCFAHQNINDVVDGSKASLFENTDFSESQEKVNSLLNDSNTQDEKRYFQDLSEKWKNNNKQQHQKYAVFEYPD